MGHHVQLTAAAYWFQQNTANFSCNDSSGSSHYQGCAVITYSLKDNCPPTVNHIPKARNELKLFFKCLCHLIREKRCIL